MTGLHVALGAALIAVNVLAGLLGAHAWRTGAYFRAFWPLVRTGQALVAIVALQGLVLQFSGADLPELHLVYGLVPVGISFIAEQLRILSAQTVLDQRGLEDAEAVRRLPEAGQRSVVIAIVARETGVMAAAALVIAVFGIRASGLL